MKTKFVGTFASWLLNLILEPQDPYRSNSLTLKSWYWILTDRTLPLLIRSWLLTTFNPTLKNLTDPPSILPLRTLHTGPESWLLEPYHSSSDIVSLEPLILDFETLPIHLQSWLLEPWNQSWSWILVVRVLLLLIRYWILRTCNPRL